jgi:two-component system nitrogen regulation response regulator NtrX
MEHPWPGNVRELRNFVERLIIMCPDATITGSQIRLFLNPGGTAANNHTGSAMAPFLTADYKEAKRMFEREYLQQKLLLNENNISKTAEQIGLERSHLHKKLKSLDIISQ